MLFLALNLYVLSYLFFYFSFSQKSPIYWTYIFSFYISFLTTSFIKACIFAFNLILPFYFRKCYNTTINNLSILKGIFLS